MRQLAIPGLVLMLATGSAFAQSGDTHAQDQDKNNAANADAAKENQRKTDEFAEAAQAINGPAGNPECVWLGRRVVRLMWVDDLDTAFRHLDLYDRFGCPGGHIQATFRCLVAQGADVLVDPKAPDQTNARVEACWINPALEPSAAGAAAAAPSGTTNR